MKQIQLLLAAALVATVAHGASREDVKADETGKVVTPANFWDANAARVGRLNGDVSWNDIKGGGVFFYYGGENYPEITSATTGEISFWNLGSEWVEFHDPAWNNTRNVGPGELFVFTVEPDGGGGWFMNENGSATRTFLTSQSTIDGTNVGAGLSAASMTTGTLSALRLPAATASGGGIVTTTSQTWTGTKTMTGNLTAATLLITDSNPTAPNATGTMASANTVATRGSADKRFWSLNFLPSTYANSFQTLSLTSGGNFNEYQSVAFPAASSSKLIFPIPRNYPMPYVVSVTVWKSSGTNIPSVVLGFQDRGHYNDGSGSGGTAYSSTFAFTASSGQTTVFSQTISGGGAMDSNRALYFSRTGTSAAGDTLNGTLNILYLQISQPQ